MQLIRTMLQYFHPKESISLYSFLIIKYSYKAHETHNSKISPLYLDLARLYESLGCKRDARLVLLHSSNNSRISIFERIKIGLSVLTKEILITRPNVYSSLLLRFLSGII